MTATSGHPVLDSDGGLMTNDWDPPRPWEPPQVPVIAASNEATRWWNRRARRLPVWTWLAGGIVGVGSVVAAANASIDTTVQTAGGRPATSIGADATVSSTSPATATIEPAPAATPTFASVSDPSTTTIPPTTTMPATVPTTTAAPATTTTTTPPPPPPPPPTTTAPTTAAVLPPIQQSDCDPNYEGACVPIASDVDCLGGSGNGPAFVDGPVYVVGRDIYGLDGDDDGVGCE